MGKLIGLEVEILINPNRFPILIEIDCATKFVLSISQTCKAPAFDPKFASKLSVLRTMVAVVGGQHSSNRTEVTRLALSFITAVNNSTFDPLDDVLGVKITSPTWADRGSTSITPD